MDWQRVQASPAGDELLAAGCGAQSPTWLDQVAMIRSSNPEVSWYQLSWNQRRQVLKHAGRGERHPDKRIADIAERWARYRLRPGRWKERREEGLLFALLDLIDAGAGGGFLGMLIAERRAARKILRVVEKPR
jgi:hypothetical protein